MQTGDTMGGPLAGRREWIGLGVLSIACLIYSMDLSVLFLAVPAIVADLDPTAAELLWINDIYGFMVAGFLVTMGTLGDRIGRRKVLMSGAAGFGAASVLAAFSTSAPMLIGARALLGIAGATIAPSTLSLIVNMFADEGERNRAIGIWGTAFSVGGLIGPVIGGLLLEWFHWGSVFLINVPIMALLLAAAPRLLPEYKSENSGRLDLLSVALSLASVLPVIYGLKSWASEGFGVLAAAPVLAGLAFGAVFIARQRRLADPMIDLSLFRIAAFNAALSVNMLGVFFVFGTFLLQNQFLQLVLGLSPLEAGLWSIAPSLVFTAMSLWAYKVTNRLGAPRAVFYGLLVNALGTSVMAAAAFSQSLYGVLGASMLIAVGFVPVILTTTGMIVGAAPPERAGAASAVSETSAGFGGALGVALLGALSAFIYRAAMAGADLTGLSPEQARSARATLGGAVEAAAGTAPVWLESARAAFSSGFALAGLTASVALIGLAWAVRTVFAEKAD